jgi:hypothetical protein
MKNFTRSKNRISAKNKSAYPTKQFVAALAQRGRAAGC